MTTAVQAKAERAADAWLAALHGAIEALPTRTDLESAHGKLRAAFSDLDPELAASLTAVAEQVLAGPRLLSSGFNDTHRRGVHIDLSRRVVPALDRALTPWPRQAELDEAEHEVETLTGRYQAGLTELEAAVVAADVDRVMALRPDVEVRWPAELAKARLRVLDLQLERVDAELIRPRNRVARADAQVADAEGAVADATTKLETARAALLQAHERHGDAVTAMSATEARANSLRDERAQLAAAAEADGKRRLRRLAGLPDEPQAEPETVASPPSMFSTVVKGRSAVTSDTPLDVRVDHEALDRARRDAESPAIRRSLRVAP